MKLDDRFRQALEFALELHADQMRKGGEVPYAAHLLGVAALALEYGADQDEAIAALLHDAIEDQGGAPTRERIRERFGARVTAIVDGCTDTDQVPRPPWLERKKQYLEHVPHAGPSVHLVSAADKLYNCLSLIKDYRRLGEALWSRFHAGRSDVIWYYRSLANIFLQQGAFPLFQDLDRAVTALEQLVADNPKQK